MKRVAATKRARVRGRIPQGSGAANATQFAGRITASGDDALETVSDGSVTLTEAGAFGLQSVTDTEVLTGLRWEVPHAPGAPIDSAFIQFTARGNNSDAYSVRIRAQAADAGAAFTTATSDVSARTLTTAYVDWVMPAWATSQNDSGTRSPDLAVITQEVVDRPGFDGVIVFVAQRTPDTAVGRRRYLSYDDDPSNAPLLIINDPVDPTPPTPPPPEELEYGFRGDPAFDKDTLSGQTATDYGTLLAEIADSANQSQMEGLAGGSDLFYKARTVHAHITSVLAAFRLTGDLALLDHVNSLADELYDSLVYGWDPATSGEAGYSDWVGFRMWRHYYGTTLGSSAYGKDGVINDTKAHALVGEIATALDVNRDLTSPAKAATYAADADKWKAYLLTDADGFLAKIYAGRHGAGSNYGFNYFRPHSDNHSWTSTIKMWYYLHRFTGEQAFKDNADRAASILWTHPVSGGPQSVSNPEYRETTDGALVWMSNVHWASTSRNYLQSTAYSGSVYADALTFFMEGYREWADSTNLAKLAKGVRLYHFLDASGSAYGAASDALSVGIAGDIGGGSPNFKPTRAGIPHDSDTNRPIRRSAEAAAGYAIPLIAAWDADDYVSSVYRAVRDEYISTSENTTRLSAALFINSFLRDS